MNTSSMKTLLYLLPCLLLTVTGCTDPQEAREMRLLMEQADSMNRNYVPFTTDTVARRVAGWYDRHGTANERVRAHYLLGCAYRDMGEAPQAALPALSRPRPIV